MHAHELIPVGLTITTGAFVEPDSTTLLQAIVSAVLSCDSRRHVSQELALHRC